MRRTVIVVIVSLVAVAAGVLLLARPTADATAPGAEPAPVAAPAVPAAAPEPLLAPPRLRPPAGTLAVALQLGDPQRVAGFVAPGARVAVFATLAVANGTGPRTQLLLPSVPVLAVGSAPATGTQAGDSPDAAAPAEAALLTLALTPSQAERVLFAATQGQVHLGLLGERLPAAASAGVTADTVFGTGAA